MARQERAPEAGRTWAQSIAGNVRQQRRLRDLSQQDMAERMTVLGYPWSRATYSDVERHNRELTFDEVAALAIVLGLPPLELLDPLGPSGNGRIVLEFGGRERSLTSRMAREWLHGRESVRLEPLTDGGWRFVREMTPELVETVLREKQSEGPVDRSGATFEDPSTDRGDQ
jgi:transcriptional regulator with XRE-family HTH domain